MPVNEPRFLVVATDGEEINSAFKGDVVSKAAQGIPNLRVFAIDYMPGPKIDDFLMAFANANRGEARKAGTGADILALFQKFASKLEHYYIVSYEFAPPPPPPPPPPSPKTMVFAEAAMFDFNKADLKPEGKVQLKAYRETAKAELSSASKVKITGHTDNVGTDDYNMKLSLKRAEAIRDYLVSLGVDPGQDGGQRRGRGQADRGQQDGRRSREEPPRRGRSHRPGEIGPSRKGHAGRPAREGRPPSTVDGTPREPRGVSCLWPSCRCKFRRPLAASEAVPRG